MADTVSTLLFARLFGGLMAGNIPVAFAAASDTTAPQDRSKVMGRIGASFSLGFILGPAIGGVIAGPSPQAVDFFYVAGAAGTASLLALLLTIVALKESHTPERRNRSPIKFGSAGAAGFLKYFGMPVLGMLIVMNFIFIAAGSILDSTFALYSYKVHAFGPDTIGFMFTYMGVVMAIVQGVAIGPLVVRYGDLAVARTGIWLYVIGLALMIPASGLMSVLLALAFVTTGVALFVPATSSLVSKNAPEEEQGAAIGIYQAAGNLGRVITPMFSGVVFSDYGATAPFYVAIVILVPALWMAQKTKVRIMAQ